MSLYGGYVLIKPALHFISYQVEENKTCVQNCYYGEMKEGHGLSSQDWQNVTLKS
jgi:hypothetical protein